MQIGFSSVGTADVNKDLVGLKSITGLFDATWTTISSSFCHFHSSSKFDCEIICKLDMAWLTWWYVNKQRTFIWIFVAETRFGMVTGGCDVTRTRVMLCTIFGSEMSNSNSPSDWFNSVFCVAIYSRRKAACWLQLCKLDGRRRWANELLASSSFFNVTACLPMVYWMWSSAKLQPRFSNTW